MLPKFPKFKKFTVFKFSLQQISEVVVRSSLSFINSSYKRRLEWVQQTDGRTWQSLPFRYWHRFLFFPRAAVFVVLTWNKCMAWAWQRGKEQKRRFWNLSVCLPTTTLISSLVRTERRWFHWEVERLYSTLLASCTQGGDYLEPVRGAKRFPFH